MDWSGVVGLVTAAAAVVATTWAIISDRSKLKLLERVAELGLAAPEASEARRTLDELRDRAAADLLNAYKGGNNVVMIVWGAIFLAASSIGAGLTWGSRSHPGRQVINDTWAPTVVVVCLVLFLVGYSLALLGIFRRLRARRQDAWEGRENARREARAKFRSELERAKHRWWALRSRREARRILEELDHEDAIRAAELHAKRSTLIKRVPPRRR